MNDPNKVLVPVEEMEWNPEVPLAQALAMAEEALKNHPEEIEFNVTLTKAFAARFHFIKTILTSLGLPPDEADKFILHSGIESQIQKLAESATDIERE